jgi:crotonobetainyl-CoA:carnitine CoA-transferase CaiB-like acyl-CoA transferase
MFLAEAGAQVLKIEPPSGDPLRWSPGFATWNRNKRSVILDIREETAVSRLHDLLAAADVFIHGLTPDRAASVGLDDQSLMRRYPGLIICAVTGYPAGHPAAQRPGHDILVQARSGLMDEQIVDRPGPAFSRVPLPSWAAAYLSAIGILARLHHRDRTGLGGPAHTSLLQGALACLSTIWNDTERPSDRMAQKLPLPKRANPHTFQCADGTWIQVNALYPSVPLLTESLLELGVEIPSDGMDPVDKAEVYRPAFRQRSAEEWLVACWSADVSAQPVLSFGELLRDKQAMSNGYLADLDDPMWSSIRIPATPWTASWTPVQPTPAPRLGQDSGAVLEQPMSPGKSEARRDSSSRPPDSAASVRGADPDGGPSRHPLEGIKVVDFGSFVGGPYATTLLAQLGATVIKVEPKTGDRMRLDDLIFVGTQPGKRSIALDLKAKGSRAVIERLIRWADVVHHNIRTAALAGLGLDYPSVRAINPSVIYCHVSGFGAKGAKRTLPVFDPEMQALSGWLRANTPPTKVPTMVRCAPTDMHGALLSVVPTLIALLRRNETGEGAEIETSILAAMLLVTSETTLRTDADVLAAIPEIDDESTGLAPWYRIYDCADGVVAVAAMTKKRQAALLSTMAADDFDDLATSFKGLTSYEAVSRLGAAGVPAEAVRLSQERVFLNDPESLRCRLAVRYCHPIYGEVRQIGSLWDFGDLETKLDRPAPTLGQHSREILLELGVPDSEIRLLAAQGLIAGDALI